jgi:hypothetical protein
MTQIHASVSRSELRGRPGKRARRPPSSPYAWKVATRPAEIDRAQALRYRCLVGENGIPVQGRRIAREISELDLLETTKHLVLQRAREPIGTLRLATPNAEVAAATGHELGLEDEASFDFGELALLRAELGEVARVALLRRYQRGVAFATLLAGLVAVARKARVRWLVGTVDCRTFSRAEGNLMYRVAEYRGLVHERFRARPRTEALGTRRGTHVEANEFYSAEQLRLGEAGALEGLPLSGAVEIFCRAMSARVLGPPAGHPHFQGRLVMPVLADLWALPAVMRRAAARTAENGGCWP